MRKEQQSLGRQEGGSSVFRYGLYAATLGLLVKAYRDVRNLTVNDFAESTLFRKWHGFNEYLVESGWIPKYQPKGVNGKPLNVPSEAPQVYSDPPATRAESLILRPFKLRGLTLRNRVIRAAAFDGEREDEIIQTHVGVCFFCSWLDIFKNRILLL